MFDMYLQWTSDQCEMHRWVHMGNAALKDGKSVMECLPENALTSHTSNFYGNLLGVVCCDSDGSISSGQRPDCKQSASFSTARSHCVDHGLRLCTRGQIQSSAGMPIDCNFDHYLLW